MQHWAWTVTAWEYQVLKSFSYFSSPDPKSLMSSPDLDFSVIMQSVIVCFNFSPIWTTGKTLAQSIPWRKEIQVRVNEGSWLFPRNFSKIGRVIKKSSQEPQDQISQNLSGSFLKMKNQSVVLHFIMFEIISDQLWMELNFWYCRPTYFDKSYGPS